MIRLLKFLLAEIALSPRTSLLILALTLCSVAYPIALSYSFVYLIDHVLGAGDGSGWVWLLAALGIGGLLAAASDFGAEYALLRSGIRMQDRLRYRMFGHLQLLPESYYRHRQGSSIVSRLSADLNNVHASFLAFQPIGSSLLGIAISFVLLATMSGWLATLLLLGLPCCFLVSWLLGTRAKALSEQYKNQENFTGLAMDRIVYHQVIRSFGLRAWELHRLKGMTDAVAGLGLKAQFLRSMLGKSVTAGLLLLNVILLAGGVLLHQRGLLTIGVLVSFQSFYLRIGGYLNSLTRFMPVLVQGALSYERIQGAILQQAPDPAEAERERESCREQPALERSEPSWEVKQLSFRYSDNVDTLSNVSLELPPGAYCAIVGSSGSGKSSLVGLLMRFHEPNAGTIELSGINVRDLALEGYRSRIGYVSQEIVLFDSSLRENIRMGNREATDIEIEEAAKAAAIHDWILSLPKGYETMAGEKGSLLSGGERQRIALARALVRKPELLLLDEVTSMLDPGAEQEVNDTLLSLKGSATVVSVTHRLQTIREADRIFVLNRGRIVGWGQHEELLQENEHYRSMWMKQSGIHVSDNGRNAVIDTDRLRRIPLFQTLDNPTLEELRLAMWTENVEAGKDIVKQGEQGDTFYLVARGQVEVLLGNDKNEQTRVAVLEDGDFFGEMALLKELPRTSTVRAITNSVFLVMNRKSFRRAIEADDRMRKQLEETYARRFEELSKLQ